MRTVLELQDERATKIEAAQGVLDKAATEDRALNDEEKTNFDALQRDSDGLEVQIHNLQETERRRNLSRGKIESLNAVDTTTLAPTPTGIGSDPSNFGRPRLKAFTRYGTLSAFDNNEDGYHRAYRSGMWVKAALLGDEVAKTYCREHGVSRFAQSEGVNSAGGYLVPEEFTQAIILLREAYGVFRPNTSVLPMGRDVMNVPRSVSGTTATFTNENTALTESDAAFNNVQLTAKKSGILTRMSTEVADDAIINMADWLAMEYARAFALQEDTVGFVGAGTAAHGSIVGAFTKFTDDNTLAGAVDAISGEDQFSELTIPSLNALMGTLPAYARPNAKWYCSAYAADVCFMRLLAAGGGNTINTLAEGKGPAFLGHPIQITQVATASAAALNNTAMLLFGDLKMASTLGDRRGISVARSDDRYFELDQIGMRATTRFDIVVHDVGNATTAGPIVALIGQT